MRLRASLRASARRLRVLALVFSAAACSLLVAPPANAAEAPLSLAEALRIGVARSPQIASNRALVESANVSVIPAGALPDPKFKTTLDSVPTNTEERWTAHDPVTMLKVGLIQEFPGYTKLDLRTQRAQRDARRESEALEVQRAAVQRSVATAWISLRFALEADAKVGAQIAEAELGVDAANAQYRARTGSQADLIALQSAVADFKNRRTELAARIKRARIALARYIGADADRPLGDLPDIDRMPDTIAEPLDADNFPDVRAAWAQEDVAAADADIAGAETWPDWKVELSYAWRGRSPIFNLPFVGTEGGTPYAQLISLEVTVDLPLFSGTRQRPRHEAKLKELDAARAMREETKRRQTAEVRSMIAEWDSARTQGKRIKEELIPLVVQKREAALAAYRGGTGGLAAVLEARRDDLDAHLSLVQQELAAGKAWAWLAFAYPAME